MKASRRRLMILLGLLCCGADRARNARQVTCLFMLIVLPFLRTRSSFFEVEPVQFEKKCTPYTLVKCNAWASVRATSQYWVRSC